jgi:signal transduction histidine kinase
MADLESLPNHGDAAAFAAHALSNYLAVIGTTIDLVQLRLGRKTDPQIRVWLDGLQHATALMGRTVSQLLDVPGTDAKLRLEAIEVPAVLQRLAYYYGRLGAPKGISIVTPPDREYPRVWTDRVIMGAVLDNLFSNAVKFSPPNTTISIEVRLEPEHVVFGVRDHGPGLSVGDQARLFQRGVVLTPKPTGGEPSAGYGLAVAKQLCERLGVDLWCESVEGHGATFCVRLPVFADQQHAHGS